MGILQGWHHGERAIQRKLGFDGPMSQAYTWIDGEMPEQHRIFHTTRLPFIPMTTLDASGRPWSSIVAGPSGKPGFVTSPNWDLLEMDIRTWDGDPFAGNIAAAGGNEILTAGIGIELSTRRRNKFAGRISKIQQDGRAYKLRVEVNQAIGNCPKYINIRELDPFPETSPAVAYERLAMNEDERLPEELIAFIRKSDTVFLGTTYKAPKEVEMRLPSHVGQNQRGGRPGFMRVKPSDGRSIVLPDFSGNRLMTSLGNIEASHLAALTMVDFVTGDILYLTGNAQNLVGAEAQAIMPRQNALTDIRVTGYIFVHNALPVRQRPDTEPERSPYSPPIRPLIEETPEGTIAQFDKDSIVTFIRVRIHSDDLATFTFETAQPIHFKPGQTAVLDFTDLVGAQQYAHMAPMKPTSINDDRIRTWTISSIDASSDGTKTFDLTMREKPGGLVTGALFMIARTLVTKRPELLEDFRSVDLRVKLVGIAGSFTFVNHPQETSVARHSALWLAGGIGVTPFMSMMKAIMQDKTHSGEWDIVLGLATREPEVLLPLLTDILDRGRTSKLKLHLHVFSNRPVPSLPEKIQDGTYEGLDVAIIRHNGRINDMFLEEVEELTGRTTYMCGPEEFERKMLDLLGARGVSNNAVVRESFEY
ncbi:hypothetical protein BDY19DRAFT_893860 [Irpex rosettiformis]|uniref:Uncharacterized protein n=1 Tax=Irpex rosettiformis TaxID=378272 RepID=A0ACB8TYJ6_9APHY|nr:hypothetical protein BDY19DRAFT_893860 [Irpex rosettiformis]